MPNIEKTNKNDVRSKIIRFLTKADIILNAEEEMILARWEHVDHLMRQRVEVSDIILKHTGKFQISKFTADADMVNAQEVFGRSRKLNKRYLGHLHLQDIEQDLKKIRKMLLGDDAGPPDAKEIAALAKLHESYTYQLNSLPDDIEVSDAPKPIIIFELVGGEKVKMPMDVAEALKRADQMIDSQTIEDIDHEDLPE